MAIPIPAKYIADFEQLGLGMFVHWGLYSQLGMGEWTYHLHKRCMEDYEKLAQSFTAEDFDADELVLTAKRAGCKYVTLTTRHHEGFSLYDTCGLSDFDVMHTPAGRDLVREFTDACRRHGILPFFYHTTLDWHHPDFEGDFDRYLEYLRQSVELLCKNYGRIGGLWFDGNWSKPHANWKLDELYATIRKYHPEAMIINNTGLGSGGRISHPEIDAVTFEQGRPTALKRDGMPKYVAAEMCHTLNDHWGIGENDFNYQSPCSVIEHLCACRRVGANYLINIGPTAQGGIDPMQSALMGVLGKWVALYGEAIYNGKPHPATCMSKKDFALKADGYLYFFIHDLKRTGSPHVTPEGRYCGSIAFNLVSERVTEIEWMDNGERLNFTQSDGVFSFFATGFPYGTSTCVRVDRAKIEEFT